jgi:hypothetical protein
MSDHNQLARTGTGAALVIGGTAITGFWLLAVAFGLVAVGAIAIRFGFRRGRSAGQR